MARGRKIFERVENTDIKILSKEQKEILFLICDEMLTPAQIGLKRNTTAKAVYKIITKLKLKGFIKGVEKSTLLKGGSYHAITPSDNKNKEFRLHGQSLTIEILLKKEFYINLRSIKNKDEIDKNSIMLNENILIIYLNKDFWGSTINECVKKYLEYLDKFITILENKYKIILRTATKCNIKEFRSHIAKVGDIIAKEINIKGEKLKVYDENGILRLLIDKSFNWDELEAVDQQNNILDMQQIQSKYLDLIKTDFKLSEAKEHIISLQERDNQIQNKLEYITEVIGNMSIILNNNLEIQRESLKEINELKNNRK